MSVCSVCHKDETEFSLQIQRQAIMICFLGTGKFIKKMGLLPSASVKHELILNFTDTHSNKSPDLKSIEINSGIDSGTTCQLESL